MLPDPSQPQGSRVADQLAQDAAAVRELADALPRGVVETQREKAVEVAPRLAEHAERRIPRAGQVARRLEHALQHHLEVELGEDAACHVEHPAGGPVHS